MVQHEQYQQASVAYNNGGNNANPYPVSQMTNTLKQPQQYQQNQKQMENTQTLNHPSSQLNQRLAQNFTNYYDPNFQYTNFGGNIHQAPPMNNLQSAGATAAPPPPPVTNYAQYTNLTNVATSLARNTNFLRNINVPNAYEAPNAASSPSPKSSK